MVAVDELYRMSYDRAGPEKNKGTKFQKYFIDIFVFFSKKYQDCFKNS